MISYITWSENLCANWQYPSLCRLQSNICVINLVVKLFECWKRRAFSFKHKSESINKKQRSQYLKLLEIKGDFEYSDLLSHRLKMCVQNSRNTKMLLDSVMIINLLFNFLLHFNKTCFGIFNFESRKWFYKDNVK